MQFGIHPGIFRHFRQCLFHGRNVERLRRSIGIEGLGRIRKGRWCRIRQCSMSMFVNILSTPVDNNEAAAVSLSLLASVLLLLLDNDVTNEGCNVDENCVLLICCGDVIGCETKGRPLAEDENASTERGRIIMNSNSRGIVIVATTGRRTNNALNNDSTITQ